MKAPFKILSTTALLAGLLFGAAAAPATAAPVGDGSATPNIIGGAKADDISIVQLVFTRGSGSARCTGTAISEGWVLTAKHCVKDSDSVNVYYSNDTANRGPAIGSKSFYQSPNGDVALIKLSSSHALNSYHRITDSYKPASGDKGDIYGYGRRADHSEPDHLYGAQVQVTGSGDDAFGGPGINLKAVTGVSWSGDSGGPLIINNEIVGTSSHGPSDRTIKSIVNYTRLSASSSWVKKTAGL